MTHNIYSVLDAGVLKEVLALTGSYSDRRSAPVN